MGAGAPRVAGTPSLVASLFWSSRAKDAFGDASDFFRLVQGSWLGEFVPPLRLYPLFFPLLPAIFQPSSSYLPVSWKIAGNRGKKGGTTSMGVQALPATKQARFGFAITTVIIFVIYSGLLAL